ncbi:MAG: hypothetical protein AAF671_11230 [Pseudomonadota bacterium]
MAASIQDSRNKPMDGAVQSEVEKRLDDLLMRLQHHQDVPPGPLHRLEGLLEAVVLLDAATIHQLNLLLDQRCLSLLGQSMEERLGKNWREHYPFPQLPLYAARAPVVPST